MELCVCVFVCLWDRVFDVDRLITDQIHALHIQNPPSSPLPFCLSPPLISALARSALDPQRLGLELCRAGAAAAALTWWANRCGKQATTPLTGQLWTSEKQYSSQQASFVAGKKSFDVVSAARREPTIKPRVRFRKQQSAGSTGWDKPRVFSLSMARIRQLKTLSYCTWIWGGGDLFTNIESMVTIFSSIIFGFYNKNNNMKRSFCKAEDACLRLRF